MPDQKGSRRRSSHHSRSSVTALGYGDCLGAFGFEHAADGCCEETAAVDDVGREDEVALEPLDVFKGYRAPGGPGLDEVCEERASDVGQFCCHGDRVEDEAEPSDGLARSKAFVYGET